MKRLAIFVAFIIAISGTTPAFALEKSLSVTGLDQAVKDGFTGKGMEFAVISEGFLLKNKGVKAAVSSEACFSDADAWEKCPNKKASQVGKGAATKKDLFQHRGDRVIHALAGTADSIAPKAKVHAIRAVYADSHFAQAIDYAISKKVTAILVTDSYGIPIRGHEVNCDAYYPEQAKAAKKAADLGIAIFAESGIVGNTYGLAFPSCLTNVIPTAALDFNLEVSDTANLGPGLVLAYSTYETLDPIQQDGKDWFTDSVAAEKATAVIAGIYAALRSNGYSSSVAAEAISKSSDTRDSVIVKGMSVANYESAMAWAKAKKDSIGVEIGGLTQTSESELLAVLSSVPAKRTQTVVTGYEIYDFDSLTWKRTAVAKSTDGSIRISTSQESGWLRLVVSKSGKAGLTSPVSFSLESKPVTSSVVETSSSKLGVEVEYGEAIDFEPTEPSTSTWSTISDPAVEKLELSYARDLQVTGKGVTVAIIDDGFQSDHPYLTGGRVVEGLCLEMTDICPNGKSRQEGPRAVNPGPAWWDESVRNDHGTMVAGTIGGYPTAEATGGIAPDVNFIVARVDLNGGDDNGGFIDQALEWIYGLSDNYNIAAINMSFGYARLERDQILNGSNCSNEGTFEATAAKLKAKGIASIVASGNEGLVHGIGGPACEDSAIAVGATDNDGSIILYSNISSDVDIVAPARMRTSLSEGTYGEGSGTSNSTPVVAGAFALAKQYRPDLSVDEVLYAMQQSADRVDDVYVKDIPRLNIRKFLEYITPGSEFDGLTPVVTAASKGVSCEVSFDANGGKSPVLRYRAAGESSWWVVSVPSSKLTLPGLAASTSYEIEVGAQRDGVVLWSSRETCTTSAGGKPGKLSGVIVESRGKDWAVAYVPPADANGFALSELQLKIGSKTSKAIWLGSDRYLITKLPSTKKTKVSMAFANSKGAASWASVTLPAYSAKSYTSTSLVSSSGGSKLSNGQKAEVKADIGSHSGVTSITCTALQDKKASSSEKRNMKSRAQDACNYSKSLHKKAKVTLKTRDVTDKNLFGVIEVVVAGKN